MDILASVRKGADAEVRVTRDCYNGRSVVDFRIWSVPPGGGEMVRSRKGFTIDAAKLSDLLGQLVGK